MQASGVKTGLTAQADASSRASVAGGLLQRNCECGSSSGLTSECAECSRKSLLPQRKAARPAETAAVTHWAPEALRAPGQPMRAETLKFMESRIGHDFGRLPVFAREARSNVLQVGSPSDTLEQEADRVADKVMRMWPGDDAHLPFHQDADPKTVRRTTYSPYSISEGTFDEGEEEEQVQAKAAPGSAGAFGPAASDKVSSVVQSQGAALPDATRAHMESRFGYDFSRVRIHADGPADEAARAVNARAFAKGANLVFARGQYSPDSQSGRWLIAHELAHVVQQGHASARSDADSSAAESEAGPAIGHRDRSQTLRRVRWGTATDTGRNSRPWGTGPNGDVYRVDTNGGTSINAWKPHDGRTYWCHGFTFGGSSAAGGPFSIWGQDVPTVLRDDGWQTTYSCMSRPRDILVFAANNVAHSGIIDSVSAPGAIVDDSASMLDSKWGQAPQNVSSWEVNAAQYGRYKVYSKEPLTGVCAGEGANES